MQKNLGKTDKIIRVSLALVFVILFLTNTVTGTLGYILMALALVFLVTSLIGICPLYSLFGIRSVKKSEPQAS